MSDLVPSGFFYSGNVASPGTGYTGGQGTWTITPPFASNAMVTLDITAQAITNGIYTNTAIINVPAGLNDPNTNNNSASAIVTNLLPVADLSVVKFLTASNVNVQMGERARFTIIVSNAGPTTVSNVLVPDVSDAGLPAVAAILGTNASFSFASNTFTIFSVAAGSIATVEWHSDISRVGLLTNRVTVLAPAGIADTNAANNSSSAYVNVAPTADLQVFKTSDTNNVEAGQFINFFIQLRNAGPNISSNMIVQDVIPAGTTLIWTNIPVGTTFNPANGHWTVPRLTNTESLVLVLTLVHSNGGTVTNVARVVSSSHYDPTPLDRTNSLVATWFPVDYADFAVTIRLQTNLVMIGQLTRVEYVVSNLGPRDGSNITVHAPLPPGVELVSSNAPAQWTYNTASAVWTRANAMASPGASILAYDVRATNVGLKTFTAQITGSQPTDPFPANNSASTNFLAGPSLSLTGIVVQCASNGPPMPGVAIALTAPGASPRVVLTGPNGGYAFSNLPAALYTVTPASNGFMFAPPSQTVNAASNTNLPAFIASPSSITGSVRSGTNGSGLSGITVKLTGAATTTVLTDSNGGFAFTNLNPGSYEVMPQTNGVPFARFTPTNAVFHLGNPTNCNNTVTFYVTNLVVVLRAIEVNQAVQDWENSVPVVKSKPTLVRVFLELHGTNLMPVTVRNAVLRGTGPGGALGAIGGADFVVTTNNTSGPTTRTNRANSLNFTLPDNWINGQVQLAFEWTNGVVVNREPREASGAGVGSNGIVVVNFTPMPAVSVKFIRVGFTNAAGTNTLSNANIDELEARLKAAYPVARVNATRKDLIWLREQGAPFGATRGRFARLNTILGFMRLADVYIPGFGGPRDPLASKRLYYGALSVTANMDGGGLADGIPGDVSSGRMPSDPWVYGRNRHAHEMAHSLGRYHSAFRIVGDDLVGDCEDFSPTNATPFPFLATFGAETRATLGPLFSGPDKIVYGWDSHANIIVHPYLVFDLMGYCGQWRWASSFSYTNIQNALASRFGAGAPLRFFGAGPNPVYRIVRGLLDETANTVEFLPFYTVTPAEPLPTPPPGDFSLRLLNQFGVVLGEIPFQPQAFAADGPGAPDPMSQFMIPIVDDPEITRVEVWHGGNLVISRQASAHAPTVQVLSPNGGEAFGGGPINISWVGSDLDGDPLTYVVQYSPDGGTSWDTLVADWPGTSMTFDSATLVASAQGRIRVIASDTFLTSMDSSDGNFTVLNHAPAIAITSPATGAAFSGSQQLFLAAIANDIDDGPLTGTNIVWRSDLNGQLGTGESLSLNSVVLFEGNHVITGTAFDSGGLTNSASVNVVVTRDPLPQLSIESLTNGTSVLLWWPAAAMNYHLQRALSLPGVWSNVTNATQTTDDKVQVILPANVAERFFRLTKP